MNFRLRACIYRTGGLIQDQDTRISQYSTGDGQQLALPLAEVAAPLCQFCLVALR
ncbi:MAG: hypothetical protein MUO67_22295 [Anaerolineales bacterium]|nr:hypothetical protein [Anaerolineales bacterium]